MKITSNKQELFNHVYLALVAQGEPAVWGVTCTYLNPATGHKCAIGHLLPDGHPAQSHIFGVVNLYSNYPELFESNTDLDFLSRLQSAHDAPRLTNNLTGHAWVESFKKRMHLIAAEYKLTVPECGPVSCAKPECEAC